MNIAEVQQYIWDNLGVIIVVGVGIGFVIYTLINRYTANRERTIANLQEANLQEAEQKEVSLPGELRMHTSESELKTLQHRFEQYKEQISSIDAEIYQLEQKKGLIIEEGKGIMHEYNTKRALYDRS